MLKRNKKGALELSIGTIVILVLAMTMLILGVILVQNIFSGATDAADLTIDQLKGKISTLFGADKKIAMYPENQQHKIKQGDTGGFGFGIKNLNQGTVEDGIFSYEVLVDDPDIESKCGISEKEGLGWITTGRASSKIPIAVGDVSVQKVLLQVPMNAPLCTIRYRLNVKYNDKAYGTSFMDITIKPK